MVQVSSPVIGSDESLKGDTFGGIIVAAVLVATPSIEQSLRNIGVQDSKKIPDKRIFEIAAAIKRMVPCAIRELFPKEYNAQTGKVTVILNSMHQQVADELRTAHLDKQCVHVVDEYPGCAVGDIRLTKAESHYIAVAAASIIARANALAQMELLSQQIGFTIPKGSTHVSIALDRLRRSGLDPKNFVKMHFSNVKAVFK